MIYNEDPSKIIERQRYDFFSKYRLDQLLEEVERFSGFFSDNSDKITESQRNDIVMIAGIIKGFIE